MNGERTLDEESIIRILWSKLGKSATNRDPFEDDAAWVINHSKEKFLVAKADMFVASTDAPPQMQPWQMARKSIVACISDLAAKGVHPDYCLISIGLPKHFANEDFVSSMAEGFSKAESEYGVKIIGGDTNATSSDFVIDCSISGFATSLVHRKGARTGDLVGVSGKFGAQPAGLLILLGKAKSSDKSFETLAVKSVLEPEARLDAGLSASKFLSSCIDSSDGLAISLYHLIESNEKSFDLDVLPIQTGAEQFALENGLESSELVLFGGEEYELVGTYSRENEEEVAKLGFQTIGKVIENREGEPMLLVNGEPVARRGWIHFKS